MEVTAPQHISPAARRHRQRPREKAPVAPAAYYFQPLRRTPGREAWSERARIRDSFQIMRGVNSPHRCSVVTPPFLWQQGLWKWWIEGIVKQRPTIHLFPGHFMSLCQCLEREGFHRTKTQSSRHSRKACAQRGGTSSVVDSATE